MFRVKLFFIQVISIFIFLFVFVSGASAYTVCAVMESGFVTEISDGACAGSANGGADGGISFKQETNNHAPSIAGYNFSRANKGQPYSATILASDKDGDLLTWEITPYENGCTNDLGCDEYQDESCGDDWTDWASKGWKNLDNGSWTTQTIRQQPTSVYGQLSINFGIAGDVSRCFFNVKVVDGRNSEFIDERDFYIQTNEMPIINASNYTYTAGDGNFKYSFEAYSDDFAVYPLALTTANGNDFQDIEITLNDKSRDKVNNPIIPVIFGSARFVREDDKYIYSIDVPFNSVDAALPNSVDDIVSDFKVTDKFGNSTTVDPIVKLENNAPIVTIEDNCSDGGNRNGGLEEYVCNISVKDPDSHDIILLEAKVMEGNKGNNSIIDYHQEVGADKTDVKITGKLFKSGQVKIEVKAKDQFDGEVIKNISFSVKKSCGDGGVDTLNGNNFIEQCDCDNGLTSCAGIGNGNGDADTEQYECNNCRWESGWLGDGIKNGEEVCDPARSLVNGNLNPSYIKGSCTVLAENPLFSDGGRLPNHCISAGVKITLNGDEVCKNDGTGYFCVAKEAVAGGSSTMCSTTDPSKSDYACCEIVSCSKDGCNCCGRPEGAHDLGDGYTMVQTGDDVSGGNCKTDSCKLFNFDANKRNWKFTTNHTRVDYRCWK